MLHDIWVAIDEGRYPDAERQLDQDRDLRSGRAGQMALGYVYASTGRFDEARAVFGALRDEAREEGDDWEHIALHQLGMVERLAGDWPQALARFQEEAALIAALGDRPHKQAVNAYELGMVHLQLGQLDEARRELERSLANARRQDDPVALGCAERGLGDLARAEGQLEVAADHYAQARAAFEDAEDEAALRDLAARLPTHGA